MTPEQALTSAFLTRHRGAVGMGISPARILDLLMVDGCEPSARLRRWASIFNDAADRLDIEPRAMIEAQGMKWMTPR